MTPNLLDYPRGVPCRSLTKS